MVYWTFTQLGQRGMWKLDGTIFYGLTLNSEWPPKFPPMHTWKIYLEVHSKFVDLVKQFKMSTHLQQCVSQNSRLGLFHLNWENPKVTEAPAYEACDCTCTPLHTPKISETWKKKSMPCLIKKTWRCAVDCTSKTMFFISHFL